MSQNNPGGNNINKPRRTSTTSTSKRINQLNPDPSFSERSTGQVMPVSSSKNLSQRSSSGKKPGLKPPRPPTLSSSSSSSLSSLNIDPIDITTQINNDRKNVVNAIQNNRKIEKSVIDFDKKKFSVMSNFLEFEKEDGTYRIPFSDGYAEVGNKNYLGKKKNGKYYIVIKRMPYNELVDRKNEELIRSKKNINELNNTIQKIFPKQSYYSNNNNS